MRKDRPPANRGRIQDRTDRALIGRYEIRAFKSVAYEMLSAVARRQVPAEILRRITNMSELPVEQRGHPPVFDEKVGRAKVAVYEHLPRRSAGSGVAKQPEIGGEP